MALKEKPRWQWRPYAVALTAVIAAAAARAVFLSGLGTRALYTTFYPAVMLAAFYGGLPAGFLATTLSAVAASYWFQPAGVTQMGGSDWFAMLLFVLCGFAVSGVCEGMRRAQERAITAAADARVAVARQREAEELHRTSEHASFLADIIESSEQPVAVGYPDGRIGTCNRAYCELTGYTAAELRSLSWVNVLTPAEWRASEMAALAELERTGRPVRYQKEYVRKDLTRVPIELLVHVSRNAAGKTQYYYSFLTDITERKRAEEELRRQREWLRVTLSSIGDAVMAVDTEANVTFLNSVAAGLTGWTEDEALGRPVTQVFRIVNEETGQQSMNIVEDVLRDGRVVMLANHTALISKDGREIPVEDSAAPIRDSAGHVSGVVIVFHDVTEKRRAQEALKRSEAQLQTILENLSEGLVASSLEGEVFLWNRAALDIHGFKSLEECRRVLPAFAEIFELSTMDGVVLPLEQWPLARILRGEKLRDVEIQVRRLKGHWRRVFNYGGALVRDAEGKPLLAVVSVNDITERKQAEQAVRESESRLRAVGDNLPEGAVYRYVQAPDGRPSFEFISAGIERLTGVPVAEVMADAATLHATIVPEDYLRLQDAERRSSESLMPFEMELRQLHRKTGDLRWSLLRSMPTRRADGTTLWDGVQLEITRRKDLEQQLRQRVEELQKVMELAPVAIWVAHDPQCREIVGNRMANQFYEADAGENVSANVTPLRRFFQQDREVSADELPMQQAAALGQDIRDAELGVLMPSGKRIHMLGHASPLRDDAGQVRGCVGAFLDITRRKQAEESLRRSEAVYRAIARNIPEGAVAVVDTELRYVILEGSLLAPFGIEAGRIEGRHVTEPFGADEILPGNPEMFQRALAGESPTDESICCGRDLSTRYVPLKDENGIIVGAMCLWLDITDRKRGEERMRQAQKLESVGLLAGGIAHDFNNLLTGIMGSTSLLMEDATPELRGSLRNILSAAETAAHLTRQLLAYSGKGQFVIKDLHLSRAIRDMADLLRLSIPKNAELRFDFAERLPAVAMDPGHLQQIVMNLVINAGEAIGEGTCGKISISTGIHQAGQLFVDRLGTEMSAGRYVYLNVSDTGAGMDAATMARIFDPFFTTKFTGRGLGLAAVSGIVRSQKAAIMVQSRPGQGTTFTVLFPAALTGTNGHEADEGSPMGTILVVDDEEAVRRFLIAALRKYGYRVLEAADGSEALAVCDAESGGIDAVVLDIVMPVMGGCEFMPELLKRRPQTRVLLTSGYSEAEAKRLCSSYECAAFIQKPYTVQALAGAVEKLLRTQ